jgi:predicted transcriptional regulator
MAVPERALIGWKEIAEYLRVSEKQAQSILHGMMDLGLIYHRVIRIPGHGYKRHRIVFTFPSVVQRYLTQKELLKRDN